ncbi:unnamed protein product [Cunninghamella blakesleeana]
MVAKVQRLNDQSVSLRQILERSKLQESKINKRDLPDMERGLEQIESQTKKLAKKTKQEDNVDVRAHYFLAQGGVNTQILMRDLGTIHLGVPIEARQPIQDTDVDGYLYQKQVNSMANIVYDEKIQVDGGSKKSFKEDIDKESATIRRSIFSGIMKGKTIDSASLDITKQKLDMTKVIGVDYPQL